MHDAFAKALLPEWKQTLPRCNDVIPETQGAANMESHEHIVPEAQVTANVESHDEYHNASQFEMSLDEYNDVIPEAQQPEGTQLSTTILFDSQGNMSYCILN
jgi:hypothetical protein